MKKNSAPEASPATEILVTIYKEGGDYFATRSFPGISSFSHENTIFTLRETVTSDGVEELEARVRAKGREHGIRFIHNLD